MYTPANFENADTLHFIMCQLYVYLGSVLNIILFKTLGLWSGKV